MTVQNVHKREKKKTGPFVWNSHVQYRHDRNAMLREGMDIKTVLCFMTDMKKRNQNGTLCFQRCRRILRTMCITESLHCLGIILSLHDKIRIETTKSENSNYSVQWHRAGKKPRFIFMYVKSKFEELDLDFRQNK